MDKIRHALGEEVATKLVGYACHICAPGNNRISGGIDELKKHLKNVHSIRLSVRNALPFTCLESQDDTQRCNAQFFMFKNFQSHLLKNHPLRIAAAVDDENSAEGLEEQETLPTTEDFFHNLKGITNLVIFKNTTNLEEILAFTSNYISEMRCNVAIPERFIQNVMIYTNNLINKIESYLWSKIKHIMEAARNLLDYECVVNTINSFTVGNVFIDMKDINTHIAYEM